MIPQWGERVQTVREQFEELCGSGALYLQRCGSCDRFLYPPDETCPTCLSTDLTWTPASGRGVIWSWIRMHRSYAGCPPAPYCVGFVQLDEGPMMMVGLVDDDREYRCGEPVDARAVTLGDGTVVLQFASTAA